MDDALAAKIIVLCLLAAISTFIGILPLFLGKLVRHGSKTWEKIMSCFLCAGGGVLLALCFTHIIPEMREGLEANVESGTLRELKVPLCEVAVCMGFFFIYLIEEIVHFVFGTKTDFPGHEHEHQHNNHHNESVSRDAQKISTVSPEVGLTEEGTNIKKEKEDMEVINAVRAFLMVLALSFHGIMEGIMIGVQEESNDVWLLFAAVGLHKFAIMFCLSVELLVTQSRIWMHVCYVVIYGFISSIGMAIGIGIYQSMASNNTDSPAINILQCIAAGTLIYVAFFEVLYRERMKHGNGILKLVMVLLGFGVLLTIDSCFDDGD